MSTPLKAPATIGSKVASIVVQSVTVHASGVIVADWQGLDASGTGVVRQNAALAPDAAAPLRAAPASELVARAEALIVQAIGSGGEAPPQNLPPAAPKTPGAAGGRRGFPPSVQAALTAARARPRPEATDLHPATRGGAPAPATTAATSPALPAAHPYAAAAALAATPPAAPSAESDPIVSTGSDEVPAEGPELTTEETNRLARAALAELVETTAAPAAYPEGHPYAPKAPPADLPSTSAPTEPPPDASAAAEVPPDPPTTPIYPKGHPYAPKP